MKYPDRITEIPSIPTRVPESRQWIADLLDEAYKRGLPPPTDILTDMYDDGAGLAAEWGVRIYSRTEFLYAQVRPIKDGDVLRYQCQTCPWTDDLTFETMGEALDWVREKIAKDRKP